MRGSKIVNNHNVLDNYASFITKLDNARKSPDMVILQKDNEPILEILNKKILIK